MSAVEILDEARSLGVNLRAEGDRIKAKGPRLAVERLLPEIRAYKLELLCLLDTESPPCAETRLFQWLPLDADNMQEILNERIGVLLSDGMREAEAVQEASWQFERDRCWERFQSHARTILEASGQDREALLEQYARGAASSFGQKIASHMTETMRSWVEARTGGCQIDSSEADVRGCR